MLNFWKSCGVAITLCVMATSFVAAKTFKVPGTTVTVEAPDHYKLGDKFAGLEYKAKSASLVVNELPAAAKTQLKPLLTDFKTAKLMFKRQKIDLTKTETVTWQGKSHKVFRGTQVAFGNTFDKWIAGYFGENVVLVTFQAPKGAVSDKEIKSLFANVSLGKAPTRDEKLSLLPYQFGKLGKARIMRVMAQNTTALTIGNKDVDPEGDQPLLIVAPAIRSTRVPSDMKADGLRLVRSSRDIADVKFESGEAFDFKGEKGYKLVTSARSTSNNRDVKIVQWMRYRNDGYVRVIAFLPAEKAASAEKTFQKVVNGMTFKN